MRQKFGSEGLRVYRLLLQRGQLEQKAVGDLAMIAAKDVRTLLYNMLAAGYVALQVRNVERGWIQTCLTCAMCV